MAVCDIVIPFYQRAPGILSRALESIFRQSMTDYRIIVVDDGSPSPAELDLTNCSEDQIAKIHIVKQVNGGVSKARNTGLNAVSDDAEFVAFLDSDDEWTTDHLTRAATAMSQDGVDLFWDALAEDAKFGDFAEPSRLIDPAIREALKDCDGVYEVFNMRKVMCGPWWRHLHLSCTVISAQIAKQIRFREDLGLAEDFEFFLQCAQNANRVTASDIPGTERGEGDNIWHGVTADDIRYAEEKLIMADLLLDFREDPLLDAKDQEVLHLRLQNLREQFYWSQTRRIKAMKFINLDLLIKWLARDPGIVGLALSLIFKTSKTGGKTMVSGDNR